MTTNDTFGRNLSTWLREEAEHRVPDHLGEVLVRTAATRQRPWWSSPERWLPMDLTRPRAAFMGRGPMLRPLVLLMILTLLAVAILAVAVGSRNRTLDPFGLARNGTWVSSRDGDIYTIDPSTSSSSLIIGGADAFDFSPIYSRDGTKFVFLRSDGPIGEPAILTLMVANSDGSAIRSLTGPTESLDWFDWSPDGTRIAYMASGDLYVASLDGDQPVNLVDTGRIHYPTWLPPDGAEIIFREEDATPAVKAIRPDGTGLRTLSTTAANNEFDFQAISASPLGDIAFTRWSSAAVPRVYLIDGRTGTTRVLPTLEGAGQRGTVAFSPDGSFVAYARIHPVGAWEVVVAPTDGSDPGRTLGPRMPGPPDGSHVDGTWAFTPDGTAVIVRYGSD
ncbi:MAG TPA: DPP IV N-terminal domain-containing protein, partial [Candidatus Limnocylindrales bacterium]